MVCNNFIYIYFVALKPFQLLYIYRCGGGKVGSFVLFWWLGITILYIKYITIIVIAHAPEKNLDWKSSVSEQKLRVQHPLSK